MSLIKCPECGHTVLSVASTCPSCDHRLRPDPIPRSGLSDLAECPRCRKLLTKTTVLCPHCGFHARRFRLIWRSVAATLVLAALGVAGYFAFRPPAPSAMPLPGTSSEAPTRVVTSPPVDTLRTAVTAAQPQDTASPPTQVARPAEPATSPSGIRPVGTRYTTNWANVREARSTAAPVARVLRPGTAVRVGGLRSGWWGVFVDGAFAGYVASDLLDIVPPNG